MTECKQPSNLAKGEHVNITCCCNKPSDELIKKDPTFVEESQFLSKPILKKMSNVLIAIGIIFFSKMPFVLGCLYEFF